MMKQFCYLPFICLLILCAIPLTISAQEVHDGSEFTTTDYKNLVLPPLDLLFENAKNVKYWLKKNALFLAFLV